MAKSRNKGSKSKVSSAKDAVAEASEATDAVVDAEIVAEAAEDAESSAEAAVEAISDPEVVAEDAESTSEVEIPETAEDLGSSDIIQDAPPPAPAKGGGGFLPLFLGGVAAAAIGYAVPTYLLPKEDSTAPLLSRLDTVDGKIADIEGDVAGIEMPDLAPVAATAAEQAALIEAQTAEIAALQERLALLEARPVGDPENGVTEGDLANLRAQLEQQTALNAEQVAQNEALAAEMAKLVAQQEAGLRNAETEALNAARAAEQNAARQLLKAAVASGSPYADVAAQLDPPLPEAALALAADGISAIAALTKPFDDLARQALSVARANAPEDSGGGTRIASFLQQQLGARSTVPREGDDPDAVLSRAQAAANAGDIPTAVAELNALPDEAKSVFSDWLSAAEARAAATSAIERYLSES